VAKSANHPVIATVISDIGAVQLKRAVRTKPSSIEELSYKLG